MKRRYKIINRTRFSIFVISVFVIVIIGISSFNKVYSSIYEYSYDEIQIIEGDTLWAIALHYMPKDYDVRRMVYDIKEFNGMNTSYIYPGDILKVPLINKY